MSCGNLRNRRKMHLIFSDPDLYFNENYCNFWLGGPILKIWVSKQVPRRRKTLLYFSQILFWPFFNSKFTKIDYFEDGRLKNGRFQILSYRRETDIKCPISKTVLWSVSKVWRLVKIWAILIEKWAISNYWVIGVKQRRETETKLLILKTVLWSVSKVRRLVKIWAKSVEKWPK